MKAYPMRRYKADGRRYAAPRRDGGFTRATAVMLVLTLAALALTAIPFVIRWREDSAAFNCALSVEKMQDLLDMEVLFRQRTLTPKETREFLDGYEEWGEILCPDGGEFDAVERDSMSMEVVCCRHDSDGKRRVRLCAERALERVRKAVGTEQFYGTAFPEEVTVTLNSRPLTAKRVERPTGLRRGTSTTAGYKGIVAFYALAGQPGGMSVPETLVQYGPAEEPEEPPPDETGESVPDVPEQENGVTKEPAEAVPDGTEETGIEGTVLDETPQDKVLQEETSQEENPQDETSQDKAPQDEASRDKAPQDEAPQDESPQDEAPQEETAPDGAEAVPVESGASVSDGGVEEGEVWYFSFADENHAATWTVGEGWRVDGIRLR